MSTESRERHDGHLSRPLVYVTAVTCGVLAAMTVQMLLSRAGVELAGAWDSLFSKVPQVRSAGIWWLMVGSGFFISAAVRAPSAGCRGPGTGFVYCNGSWQRRCFSLWPMSAIH